MNTGNIINIVPKETLKEIERLSEKVAKLIESIRANIGPIFLAEEQKRKLHTRYLKQRKERIWSALEEIGKIINSYKQTPMLQILLITKVLRVLMITRGAAEGILDQVEGKSNELVGRERVRINPSGALLVLDLISESGISLEGLERFLATTSRKIG